MGICGSKEMASNAPPVQEIAGPDAGVKTDDVSPVFKTPVMDENTSQVFTQVWVGDEVVEVKEKLDDLVKEHDLRTADLQHLQHQRQRSDLLVKQISVRMIAAKEKLAKAEEDAEDTLIEATKSEVAQLEEAEKAVTKIAEDVRTRTKTEVNALTETDGAIEELRTRLCDIVVDHIRNAFEESGMPGAFDEVAIRAAVAKRSALQSDITDLAEKRKEKRRTLKGGAAVDEVVLSSVGTGTGKAGGAAKAAAAKPRPVSLMFQAAEAMKKRRQREMKKRAKEKERTEAALTAARAKVESADDKEAAKAMEIELEQDLQEADKRYKRAESDFEVAEEVATTEEELKKLEFAVSGAIIDDSAAAEEEGKKEAA